MKNFLKNKSILITGGTDIWSKIFRKIISTDFKQIRILSRDEKTRILKIK